MERRRQWLSISRGVTDADSSEVLRDPSLHFLALISLLLTSAPAGAQARLVASHGDATIVHDSATGSWTIGAASFAMTLGLDSSQALVVRRVMNPETGRLLIDRAAPDAAVTLNGQSI